MDQQKGITGKDKDKQKKKGKNQPMNEWDAIKVKRIKRLRQISFPLKPFDHSERERERERNLEGGPDCRSRSGGNNESTADLRWVMTNLPSGVYDLQKFRFIFHFSDSEIKREIPWGRAGRSTGAEADLRSAMRGERRRRQRASYGVAATWSWVCCGLIFVCVFGNFFFFLDKNLCLFVFVVFLSVFGLLLSVEFGLLLSLICSV